MNYNENDLFVSLQLLEKMRIELIQTLIKLKEHEIVTGGHEYTENPLNLARREAIKRLGRYRTLYIEDNQIKDANALKNDGAFIVHQLSYYGTLPPYKEGYHALVRQYYQTLTPDLECVRQKDLTIKEKALVLIIHYYTDNKIRDLDNRNRKYIIDMIRNTQLVVGDSWQDLAIYEEGFIDECSHLQVYILENVHKNAFLRFFEEHHNELKIIPSIYELSYEIKERKIENGQSATPRNDTFQFEIAPTIEEI